jgi:hypothetical protein
MVVGRDEMESTTQYKELGLSTIHNELYYLAHEPRDWFDYFNFNAKIIDPKVYEKEALFRKLKEKHNFTVGIIKLDPHVCYNWHQDTQRGVGINMLINEVKSHCLFATHQVNEIVTGFTELKYKPHTYYLFNTQVPHMVINFAEPRYMLTVEFEKHKNELTYKDVLNDLS